MTGTDPSPALPPLPALGDLPALPAMGDVRRRPPATGARRLWQDATVVALTDETPRVRTFTLALPDGEPHVPGQHYVLRLTAQDGTTAQRSYSVGSAPWPPGTTAPTIDLTIERIPDGDLSPALHDHVRIGDRLSVRGPFGGWFIWRGEAPALLVGGGSGIVPLMAMARWRAQARLAVPLHLVVAVRSPQDLIYADDLLDGADSAAGAGIGTVTTVAFSRSTPPGFARPPARLGPDDLEPSVRALGSSCTAYVCGSAGFAEHASQLLVRVGMAAERIRVERFGPA